MVGSLRRAGRLGGQAVMSRLGDNDFSTFTSYAQGHLGFMIIDAVTDNSAASGRRLIVHE